MKAHTPGPWKVRDNMLKEDGSVLDRPGDAVCQHCKRHSGHKLPAQIQVLAKGWGVAQLGTLDPAGEHEQHVANARLIAAAPELLDVVRRAVEVLDAEGIVYGNCDDEPLDVLSAARALLARIDGAVDPFAKNPTIAAHRRADGDRR